MNDSWDSEECDPIKDIEAGMALMRKAPSWIDIHGAQQSYWKMFFEAAIRNSVDKDCQQQVLEMIEGISEEWDSRIFHLRKILLDHPEFRTKD